MSHDPRRVSSPPRPPAPRVAEPTRPRAGYYRARIVEIKRRAPSSRACAHSEEARPMIDSPRQTTSPSEDMAGPDAVSTSPSQRRTRQGTRSGGSPSRDVPPPPPPHSPTQRSISIARGSYMDYESGTPSSRPAHFSQPFHPSSPIRATHQQQDDSTSRASPVTAIHAARAGRSFRYDVENEAVPHQSVPSSPPPPPPPRHRQREKYDPRRLFPTAVRPPHAFQFELEEEPTPQPFSEPHVPGRFPSSPQAMDTDGQPADSQMGGVQEEELPKLRPKAGSYRELEPYELGLIYSNPAPYPTPSSDAVPQDTLDPSEPFIFEVRSPRKGTHDGSNKPVATSRQAAYYARNPAHEAETFPLLRRLGVDERYATSFRTGRSESAEQGVAAERVGAEDHDGVDTPMAEATSTSGTDARVFELERQRSERRSRR